MIAFFFLSCFVAIHASGVPLVNVPVKKVEVVPVPVVKVEKPQPYSFGYTIKDKESVQTRNEAGNGAGVVNGNYGFIDNKGIQRFVDYVADNKGFRAQIKTNEPGTTGQSPAAVKMMSNDPYAQGAVVPYVSLPNEKYVPALGFSNGVQGLYTFKNFFPFVPGARGYNNQQQGGIIYYGGNLVGGIIRGMDSRFTAL